MSSVPDAAGFLTLDSIAQNFQIHSSNLADAGFYTVTVTATIAEVPLTTSFSFQVTVLNPCDLTTLSFNPTVINMLAYVH